MLLFKQNVKVLHPIFSFFKIKMIGKILSFSKIIYVHLNIKRRRRVKTKYIEVGKGRD